MQDRLIGGGREPRQVAPMSEQLVDEHEMDDGVVELEVAEEGRLKADISVFDLALKSKKIFDLEGQLAASDARMKSLLGVPRN